MKKKVLIAFGTRPEAIKMAPIVKEFEKYNKEFETKVCVTAQHRQMLDSVLDCFSIKPHYDLNIMQDKQTLFHITTSALIRTGEVLEKFKPDMVLVHGDTTTTFAVSLAAFYHRIAVGHVEAGLRSYDLTQPFPEEANRLMADAICTLHFAPTKTACNALLKENIKKSSIFITGNTVIDALKMTSAKKAEFKNKNLRKLFNGNKLKGRRIILVTAHRRENHGKPFENIFTALKRIVNDYPDTTAVIYPVHLSPAVQEPAKRILGCSQSVYLTAPVEYSDLVKVMEKSHIVVTDSGGIQEEAPSLGKPVIVLREVTERPEAVKAGTVKIAGTDEDNVYKNIAVLLDNVKEYKKMSQSVNPYGDGRAAYRTIEAIRYYLKLKKEKPAEFAG